MSSQAYAGSADRTFSQAVLRLLETDYGVLGSQRVLQLLATDVQQLVEQFYPMPERISAGWMVYTGTRAIGKKAYPGQPTSEFELVTLAWPVLLPEDLTYRASHPDTKCSRETWLRQRLVRLVEHGLNRPDGAVLLTLADLEPEQAYLVGIMDGAYPVSSKLTACGLRECLEMVSVLS